MLNVVFMGNKILVPENTVSRYAIERNVSLEEALATVNITQPFSFENVEDDLLYLLKRHGTLEEILACQWVQEDVIVYPTHHEGIGNAEHEHTGLDSTKVKVSNLDTEGVITPGYILTLNNSSIPSFTSISSLGIVTKYSKQLDSTDILNGYVDLPHTALQNSIFGALNRLNIYEGALLDFTVSIEAGVTRITLVNSILNGLEAAEVDDYLHFIYSR